MTQADGAVLDLTLAHGKHTARGGDAPLVDDRPAVMQEVLGWKMVVISSPDDRVQLDAGFGIGLEINAALQREQRAAAAGGKLLHGLHQHIQRLGIGPVEGKNAAAAQFRQHTAQLRLEDDDQRDGEEDGEALQAGC
jgi:hypothetical protein